MSHKPNHTRKKKQKKQKINATISGGLLQNAMRALIKKKNKK